MVSIIPLIDRLIPEKYPVFGHGHCLKLLTNLHHSWHLLIISCVAKHTILELYGSRKVMTFFTTICPKTQSTAIRIQSTFWHSFTLLCNLTLPVLYPPHFQAKFCKHFQSIPLPATSKTLSLFKVSLMRSYCLGTITLWLAGLLQFVCRK